MHRRVQPTVEEQEQNAIEPVGDHSADEGPLRTGLCPLGAEKQHHDKEPVDANHYERPVLPHLVRHDIHHLRYAQPKDETDLCVKDLQDRIHAGKNRDGQKPSRTTPHAQDNGNARIRRRGADAAAGIPPGLSDMFAPCVTGRMLKHAMLSLQREVNCAVKRDFPAC